MRTIIYAHRDHAERALSMVAELRAQDVTALYRDVRGFGGDIERCDRVVTDDVAVAEAHEAAGIEVVPFVGREVEVPEGVPEPLDSDGGTGEGEAGSNYRVEESHGWYKLIGPEGQVGKSVRSEDDAWALLEDA